MATPILAGKAAWFGVDGTVAYSGVAADVNHVVAAGITDNFDLAEVGDGVNRIFAAAASKGHRDQTFDIIPFDKTSPSSLATAKGNVAVPAPLGVVTTASFGVAAFNGTWNYIGGGQIVIGPDKHVHVILPCRQYEKSDGTYAALEATT